MKKHRTTFAALFFTLLLLPALIAAQENQPAGWMRVQSDDGEFSVEIPGNYSYFYDRDGFTYEKSDGKVYQFAEMQMLNGSDGKTVMTVEIYSVPSPKSYLQELLERQKLSASKVTVPEQGFTAKQFEQKKLRDFSNGKDVEISYTTKLIASKKNLYIVTVANRGEQTPAFERFLSSIRLNSEKIVDAGAIKISSLKAVSIEEIGEDATDQKNAPTQTQTTPKEIIKNPTPSLILNKPFAGYTEAARQKMDTGTIRLRTTFAKDGRISKIAILSGLPNGLNRSAVFAALRIKFIPQEKDGEFQTVTKLIEYSFNIY